MITAPVRPSLRSRLAALVAVAALLPATLAAQTAPSVTPGKAELDESRPVARFKLEGRSLDVWREAWVDDGRGRPHRDFTVELGAAGATSRELSIRMDTAPAGQYRVVLGDGRSSVDLPLRLTVVATAAPPEARLTTFRLQSSYQDDVVLGRAYRLTFYTEGPITPGQTARLHSSDPSILPVPAQVDLVDGPYTVVELDAPEPSVFDPPYPKSVSVTAESGGQILEAEARVYLDTYLESVQVVDGPYPTFYPNRIVNLLFERHSFDVTPSDYTVALSTDRPEVFSEFPTAPVPGSQGASLRLGVFEDAGPVHITADDGLRRHTVTLELDKPTLTGVTFELTSVGGLSPGMRSVSRVESDQVGVHSSSTSYYEGALACRPTFDFDPGHDSWTESVVLSTDRPDLVTVQPATVTFEPGSMSPTTTVASPCAIDFSSVTSPTPVTVTATYGDQVASGTLELLPGLPSIAAVYFRDPSRTENWSATEGRTGEIWIYLDGTAPPETEILTSMEWVTAFDGFSPDPAQVFPLPASIDVSGYGASDRITIPVTAGAFPPGSVEEEWVQVRFTLTIGTWTDSYIVVIWKEEP